MVLHAPEDLEPLFKFPIHLSVRTSRENYRQIYGKSKANLWRNLSTGTPPDNPLLLQLQFTIDIFFRTVVLRKLFDIRFSYKHCNFSRVCLLVKMALKTVTRSIKDNNKARVLGRRTFACQRTWQGTVRCTVVFVVCLYQKRGL